MSYYLKYIVLALVVLLFGCEIFFCIRLFKQKKLRKLNSPEYNRKKLISGRVGFYICTTIILLAMFLVLRGVMGFLMLIVVFGGISLFAISLVVGIIYFGRRLFKQKKLRKLNSPEYDSEKLISGRIGFYVCIALILYSLIALAILYGIGTEIMQSM